MLSKRTGPDYNNFLTKKTKKTQYIPKNDGFNMSMIHITGNTYLFALRILGTHKAYNGYEIIPGNFSESKEYVCKKVGEFICSRINFGQNFFWGSWNAKVNDNTILFVGKLDYKTLTIKPNTKIKPYVFSNIKLEGLPYKYSDVRLFTANGKIYCYDGYITSIYRIDIMSTVIKVRKVYDNICKNIKTYDKNWSYVGIITRDAQQYFMFLNWFEKDALTVSYINLQNPNECIKENLITMKRDIISGLGSKVLPMFSFGTPSFEVKKGKLWVGVGHTKIMTTTNYENKNIIDFRNTISDVLRSAGNYVQHNSYYYLIYFYTLEKMGNDKYKMMVSDSYLYYFPDQKYTFSINFPMGIDIQNNSVYVSLGVGDYYNFIIKESLAYIIKSCCHNLEDFDASKYEFKLRTSGRNKITNRPFINKTKTQKHKNIKTQKHKNTKT
jgi:hypothetical protein